MNSIIQTPSRNLEQSLEFYSKLGFKILSKNNPTVVSDGKVFIEINTDSYARAGVKLYRSDWSSVAEQLKEMTTVIPTNSGYLLSDNNNVWIYLMEGESPYSYEVAEASTSILGNAAGLSIEAIGIEQSVAIWEALGFTKTMGGIEQGWIAFSNEDEMGLSLMKANVCPHLFFNPSISYFNSGKNEINIANIRKQGIPITEEITQFNSDGIVDNIIIRDPAGLGFFIFND